MKFWKLSLFRKHVHWDLLWKSTSVPKLPMGSCEGSVSLDYGPWESNQNRIRQTRVSRSISLRPGTLCQLSTLIWNSERYFTTFNYCCSNVISRPMVFFWEIYRLLNSSVKRSILAYNGQISVTTNIFESELVSMMFLAWRLGSQIKFDNNGKTHIIWSEGASLSCGMCHLNQFRSFQ